LKNSYAHAHFFGSSCFCEKKDIHRFFISLSIFQIISSIAWEEKRQAHLTHLLLHDLFQLQRHIYVCSRKSRNKRNNNDGHDDFSLKWFFSLESSHRLSNSANLHEVTVGSSRIFCFNDIRTEMKFKLVFCHFRSDPC
jgi:hypothetical protein